MIALQGQLNAQILFTESFVVILDTAKIVQGAVSPGLELQNQKDRLFKFSNSADMAIRFKRHSLGVASNFEVIKYGDEFIVSDGFVYAEFRGGSKQWVSPEYYALYHRMGVRGMENRWAGGVNMRIKIHRSLNSAVYAGLGPFYQYEIWNYDGVQDEGFIPPVETIETRGARYGAYLGFKQRVFKVIFIDVSGYYQNDYNQPFKDPRMAFDGILSYEINEHVSISLVYQLVHDASPVVPISNEWYKTFTQLTLSF